MNKFLIILIFLSSCSVVNKNKRATHTTTDSTHIQNVITNSSAKSDEINTRQIYFTANKITEIDWIRDTTFKDTVIYRPRIRIAENQQASALQKQEIKKTDSFLTKTEVQTKLQKDEKTHEKQKQSRPSALLLSIPFILLIILILLYYFRKKYL